MGFFKKVFNAVTKPIKAIVDPIIDVGTSIIKAVISPFTGAFDLPDISVDTNVGSSVIKAATVVDFNAANRPVPVLYGQYVETGTIPVFVGTHGDNSADTTPQYLYMAAIISQGFHGSSNDTYFLTAPPYYGSILSRLTINGKPVHLHKYGRTPTNISINNNYFPQYDGSTALGYTEDDAIYASGKGGVQPDQITITSGTFANRLVFQYFDGSADQPASSLLREHPDWNDDNNTLSGMHYIALRFKLQAADETVTGKTSGDGTYPNPYSSVPAVVTTTSGRSTPRITASKTSDPGTEERFETVVGENKYARYISYHKPLNSPNADGQIYASSGGPTKEKDAKYVYPITTSTTIEVTRFANFQPRKYVSGSTQPVNIHDILYNLGWTYDYVFFFPGNVSWNSDSTAYSFSTNGDINFGRLWLKHVGGGHYQFVSRIPAQQSFTVNGITVNELTFFGYNDDGNMATRINGAYPGEDLGTDSAEYRFYAPVDQLQEIENYFLDGKEMQLRVRNRNADINQVYNITSVDLYSNNDFITVGIVNEDSSKPADSFYTTVPIDSTIYIEIKQGIPIVVPEPASWDIAFQSGYNSEGLRYQSYGCDNNPIEFILDYCLNPNYGLGLSLEQLDKQSFIDASFACDRIPEANDYANRELKLGFTETNTATDRNIYMNGENATVGDGGVGQQLKLTGNGKDRIFKIDTGEKLIDNLNRILSSIGAYMYYADGKFKIKIENAGVPINNELIPPITALPITATITDDNIIETATISTSALNDRFNQLKLDYTDFAFNSQPNSVLVPDPIEDSTNIRTNYLNEDAGKILEGAFTIPSIFFKEDAKKHATLLLKKSRGQPMLNTRINAVGFNLAPGDFVRINSVALDVNDVYRITDVALNGDHTLTLNCIKHIPEFYDITDTGQVFEAHRDILQ